MSRRTHDIESDGRRPVDMQPSHRRHRAWEERPHGYQVLETIGGGSYGVVYKAKDVSTGELVALKDFLNNKSDATSLRLEGKILRSLRHDNIVNLKSFCDRPSEFPNCPALVLELCCCSLVDVLDDHWREIKLQHVKSWSLQLFKGLQYIHSCNIIHRDIKPENLLLTEDGTLKICDFGLATLKSTRLAGKYHRPGIGTRNFMSPELLLGTSKYNAAVDLWAAGCTIYELICHRALFRSRCKRQILTKMVYMLGTIDHTTLPQRLDLPDLEFYNLPRGSSSHIDEELARYITDEAARKLLCGLLRLNPDTRFSASTALSQQFFRTEPMPERLTLSDLTAHRSSSTQGEPPTSESSSDSDYERYADILSERKFSRRQPQHLPPPFDFSPTGDMTQQPQRLPSMPEFPPAAVAYAALPVSQQQLAHMTQDVTTVLSQSYQCQSIAPVVPSGIFMAQNHQEHHFEQHQYQLPQAPVQLVVPSCIPMVPSHQVQHFEQYQYQCSQAPVQLVASGISMDPNHQALHSGQYQSQLPQAQAQLVGHYYPPNYSFPANQLLHPQHQYALASMGHYSQPQDFQNYP